MSEVLIVHAVDTEGPLFESLNAKFQRIYDVYNIDIPLKKRTAKNLKLIKEKKYPLYGKENEVANMLNSHLTNYNTNIKMLKNMNSRIFSKEFRSKDKDSFANEWVFSWHCLDHVGYKINPRKRILGYHKIYDFYYSEIKKYKNKLDKIFWHFHPMSTFKEAHRCATSYSNSPEFFQILCRKIIERNNFPSCFRAGFQSERPDSNLLLEQWIPFDITNMSTNDNKDLEKTIDFKNGRSGDWRRAPKNWIVYSPSYLDYQIPGNCNRYIGRALNVLNRIASINEKEIEKAFKMASNGQKALVGLASHDFRDLEHEVNYLRHLISKVSKKYPRIKFRYLDTKSAFQHYLWGRKVSKKIKLRINFTNNRSDVPNIKIKCISGKVFGPQPFLTIKLKNGRYLHDNLDFDIKKNIWHYAFHADTMSVKDVDCIGIATNDKYGNTDIKRFKIQKNKIKFF
tara:strand:+ start:91 stop:1452 length:1362 start_codon:yes stop_codon:yes gene_type:complete